MTESPFAPSRCYLLGSRVVHGLDQRYPVFIAHTGSCAIPRFSVSLCHPALLHSLCRLLWAPAASRHFPALSPQIFPRMPGPLPRWLTGCSCRVDPGSFTPSPSQIRTWYSRIIRLVPPSEGCRLPLIIGFLPLPVDPIQRWWPTPFAPRALPRFITTTRQCAPSRRIGTFGLAVAAACAFSLHIAV